MNFDSLKQVNNSLDVMISSTVSAFCFHYKMSQFLISIFQTKHTPLASHCDQTLQTSLVLNSWLRLSLSFLPQTSKQKNPHHINKCSCCICYQINQYYRTVVGQKNKQIKKAAGCADLHCFVSLLRK